MTLKPKRDHGFPYSYGDQGGSFKLSKIEAKTLKIMCLASIPIFILPTVCAAVEPDVILLRIEKAISEIDGTSQFTRRISPVGAASCIVSGICISHAKNALASGNIPGAAAFACGAAIALCGDRYAANYGL